MPRSPTLQGCLWSSWSPHGWQAPPPHPADHPSPCRLGPNAPLAWVRACVQVLDPKAQWRSKILLGLNLYGMDYATARDAREPILGSR